MNIAILDCHGGVTIPQEIRDQLNLRPGDRLAFSVSVEGGLLVQCLPRQDESAEIHPVRTLAEIDQAIASRLADEMPLRHTSWSAVSTLDDWQ
ncbi:MAG: AbrB/MazE/SpoVT family DNA-binding domain-containing protein [Magnetococcales bacterium]|nr:AbrB/MazE/SpoVT family DNA-binding domain-containing protein [Magnetococcales bacterium]